MRVFVRRIPPGTTRKDLIRFVDGALSGRFRLPLLPAPEIRSCKIMEIHDLDIGTTERHGLLSVLPDKAARKVIRRLNGRALNRKKVLVREYRRRSRNNAKGVAFEEKRRRNLSIGEPERVRIEGL